MVDLQDAQNLMVVWQGAKSANIPVLSDKNLMVNLQSAQKVMDVLQGA